MYMFCLTCMYTVYWCVYKYMDLLIALIVISDLLQCLLQVITIHYNLFKYVMTSL